LWVFALAAIPLAVCVFDRAQRIYWVGSTDLEVEFVVTDAASGQPVEAAELLVYEEVGLYREARHGTFTLVTDEDGIARRICHDNMCSGTDSGLAFTHTYHVAWPDWLIQVSATGYEPSEPVGLWDVREKCQQQHVGPRHDKLTVRLSVQRTGS
jgi:hypothetical protein